MWGGTPPADSAIRTPSISIHPPRVGWDDAVCDGLLEIDRFQSTHPVWGGTIASILASKTRPISIHPPRVGWDEASTGDEVIADVFQSTHPVWGGTFLPIAAFSGFLYFNPPTPCGVGRQRWQLIVIICYFNPPTPCGVGQHRAGFLFLSYDFNPPTPCGVGRDPTSTKILWTLFQSTHPVWGGTSG